MHKILVRGSNESMKQVKPAAKKKSISSSVNSLSIGRKLLRERIQFEKERIKVISERINGAEERITSLQERINPLRCSDVSSKIKKH